MEKKLNITLIHCYSDFNKGDLGIILSTITNLREVYKGATINAISTYNFNDSQYKNDHTILSKYVDNLYPCIFGLLFLNYSNREYKGGKAKLLKFMKEIVRLGPLLLLPNKKFLKNMLFNKHEREAFNVLEKSDIIVSKGGSFICNEDNLRSKVAYFRLMYMFLLLKKNNIKYYIFGQSLGPVYGSYSKFILNQVLKGSKTTYLREDTCLTQYPYIDSKYCSDVIVNDTAFTLTENETIELFQDESDRLNIGLTLKYLGEADVKYTEMMISVVEYLIGTLNAHVYVFPQVTVDKDINKSIEIYKKIDDIYKERFHILSNNYTPYQLRYGYSRMKLLIGTRLHSTIFAMSALTPAINISYHGTKSQGIYRNMELDDLVVDKSNFNSSFVINLVEEILNNYPYYKEKLKEKLVETKQIIIKEINRMA